MQGWFVLAGRVFGFEIWAVLGSSTIRWLGHKLCLSNDQNSPLSFVTESLCGLGQVNRLSEPQFTHSSVLYWRSTTSCPESY